VLRRPIETTIFIGVDIPADVIRTEQMLALNFLRVEHFSSLAWVSRQSEIARLLTGVSRVKVPSMCLAGIGGIVLSPFGARSLLRLVP
jgi:hypothetical protein